MKTTGHARRWLERLRERVGGRFGLVRRLGALRNKLVVAAGRRGGLQAVSDEFWRTSGNTYLASADYYDQRERVLRELLASLPPLGRVVDLGCGDGRFTCLLGARAERLVGYDISPSLIAQARRRARDAGLSSAEFIVSELEQVPTDPRYDLVSCMGVTTCILEQEKFNRLLDRLRDLVAPGGLLLMIDSLAIDRERTAAYGSGYVAQYRTPDAYLAQLVRRGFSVVQEIVIKEWSGLVNKLTLLARTG